MHRAVLRNEDYIAFADENTVEVMAIQRLDEAVGKNDEKAGTYEVEVGGQKVKYFKEYPGLTMEDVNALNGSKAGRFNDTGGIPFTCLVDPWTEEKKEFWKGSQTAPTLMDAVAALRKTMEEEHGKGFKRKDLRKIDEAREDALEAIGKQDFTKALKAVEAIEKKAKDWPEAVMKRIAEAKQLVLDAAKKAVDDVEALEDKKEAKKQLAKFRSKLKGTGQEERAAELFASFA